MQARYGFTLYGLQEGVATERLANQRSQRKEVMGAAFMYLLLAMMLNGTNQTLTWLAILAMFVSLIQMNGGFDGLFEQGSRLGTRR
jgi:hypothetical protein